jgi:2-keto-3-deoxy-L-rhamnonate aldolase RhmA
MLHARYAECIRPYEESLKQKFAPFHQKCSFSIKKELISNRNAYSPLVRRVVFMGFELGVDPIFARGERIRRRLNQVLSGAWLSMGSSIAAEMAAGAGYDWLLFDMEHGTSEYSDLLYQLQAIQAGEVAGIVRVPAIDAWIFKRVLDLGAHGIMVPNVTSQATAERCVSFARIPPHGTRGAAQTTRASGYGVHYNQYVQRANQSILVVPQIESRAGCDAADSIAAVDGIDVLFVGPTDLSVDLGVSSEHMIGVFREAVVHVAETARRNGKAAGVLVRNIEQAVAYSELGYTFIALGSDRGLIGAGMRRNALALDGLRAAKGVTS